MLPIPWTFPKMTQVFTGHLWSYYWPLNYLNDKVEAETIWDRFWLQNLKTLSINGGNMFVYLFPHETSEHIQTEGGSMSDFFIADWKGFDEIWSNLDNFDVVYLHIVGMDHVSHIYYSPNVP